MPELRIILLVVGVLFVAGIAGYEWWRSRGTRPLAATPVRGSTSDGIPKPTARMPPPAASRASSTAATSPSIIDAESSPCRA